MRPFKVSSSNSLGTAVIPAFAGTGLVRLAIDGDLPEHQALFAGPGADRMQG